MIAYVLLLVLVVGLLLFLLASKSEVKEIGKWTFICAAFWLCYALAGHVVKLL